MNKNLKNEYPEVPENFHNRVVTTLDSLQVCKKVTSYRFSPMRVVALAATLIILLTVTVFAGNEVYKRFINKENHKVTLELEEESSTQSAEYVKLNFGYMPEYINPYDAPYKYSVGDDGAGGLTFQLFKSELAKELEITFVGSVEECMFGKYKGAVIRIDTGIDIVGESYSRQFVIYFDDFGYVLRCFVSDAVSDKDMMKIANGLSLEETDKEHAFVIDSYIPGGEEMSGILMEDERECIDKNMSEEFDIAVFSGGDNSVNYSVAVKGFDIRDNIIGLDSDCIWLNGWDAEDYFDENGNLKEYVRITYEYGDGVNTLNSIKKSENVGRKLVLVDIEIENTENYAYSFNPEFYLSDESGERIDAIINYISGQDSGVAEYMFIPFEAGETRTVTFGFIVDADADLNNLTLEICGERFLKYCVDLHK